MFEDQDTRVDPIPLLNEIESDQMIPSDSEEENESREKDKKGSEESDCDEFEDQNQGELL